MASRLLTAAEAAERLGYTERYVWRLGREGVLPRIKVPGRKYVRFDEDDVERFIAQCRIRGAGGGLGEQQHRGADNARGTDPMRLPTRRWPGFPPPSPRY